MIERASDRNAPTLVPDLAVYPHSARFSIIFPFVRVWRDSLVILSATVLLLHVRIVLINVKMKIFF